MPTVCSSSLGLANFIWSMSSNSLKTVLFMQENQVLVFWADASYMSVVPHLELYYSP